MGDRVIYRSGGRKDQTIANQGKTPSTTTEEEAQVSKTSCIIQQTSKVSLFGNSPVYPEKHKPGPLTSSQLWEQHRKASPEEYLFPSDHFGLKVEVEFEVSNVETRCP